MAAWVDEADDILAWVDKFPGDDIPEESRRHSAMGSLKIALEAGLRIEDVEAAYGIKLTDEELRQAGVERQS